MPKLPPTIYGPQFPNDAVRFDLEAFDNFTRAEGIKLVHYRAVRCPLGMVDMYDDRQQHANHTCSNGFIYVRAGLLTCQFVNNPNKNQQVDMGQIDGSTVFVSAPRFYDDNPTEEVHIVPFDRFFLEQGGILVVNWQLAQHNISGIDKMRFPVEKVELLIDDQGQEYKQDVDFVVSEGVIKWTGTRRPGYNPEVDKGAVYTIRYRYVPFYYVSGLQHEVRVVRVQSLDGSIAAQRTGQAFSMTREYVFENKQNDSESNAVDLRSMNAPANGSFGPR